MGLLARPPGSSTPATGTGRQCNNARTPARHAYGDGLTNGGITVDAATGVVRGIVAAQSPQASTFSLVFPGSRDGTVDFLHDTFV